MKYLVPLIFLFTTVLYANEFALSSTCKSCHSTIYKEFQQSMHQNSTIYKDPIHKAAWLKSPSFKNKRYNCGRCHTPADMNLINKLDQNLTVMPDKDNPSQNDAVSCAYCHRIKSIKKDIPQNYTIPNKKRHLYYGNLKDPLANSFHETNTTKNFKDGNLCIGCHSHFKNSHGVNTCSTNINNELDKLNCVSCHMPKVDGAPSSLKQREQHAYHGFPGLHNDSKMLQNYLSIELLQDFDRFFISIDSGTPHALSLHPMRTMQLKVSVIKSKKIIECVAQNFKRIIGVDTNSTLPWNATKTIQNTAIKSNEKRLTTYVYTLKKGDKVKVVIGYYLLNKKNQKLLEIKEDSKLNKFIVLKTKIFDINETKVKQEEVKKKKKSK